MYLKKYRHSGEYADCLINLYQCTIVEINFPLGDA
jgi:hypothetical protein